MLKLIEEDQVNGDKLRQAREARGWDWTQVARMCSLSVAQVKALENGGTDCFYSLPIKNNAGRKVALVLGVADALDGTVRQTTDALTQAIPIPSHADILVSAELPRSVMRSSHWVGYSLLSLTLVAVLLWSGLQMKPSSRDTRVTEVTGTLGPQHSSPSSPPIPAAIATENFAPPMSNPQKASVAAASPVTKPPEEKEIVPASLTTTSAPACAFEGEIAVIEATNPTKSAEKVSLMLHRAGKLCVEDASGKVWQEELKPWMGRTFVGKAPWKLHSPVLPNADVYFQGEKLRLTSANARTIALNGKEIQ